MLVCWPMPLMAAERQDNVLELQSHFRSVWINDATESEIRGAFFLIPWKVLGWQLQPRELSVPLLFPLCLLPLSVRVIKGQWLFRLLNTYHFKEWGLLLFKFLRSVIHTWTTLSHNWSVWLGEIFHSVNLYVQICYKQSQITEFVYWGQGLYSGLSPTQKGLF